MSLCKSLAVLFLTFLVGYGRIHNITIDSDRREIIPLANFGLTKDGFVDFYVTSLIIKDTIDDARYGNYLYVCKSFCF